MSEQQPGLRFDIYERIHLPVEMSAIHELDEVELTPQIRVDTEGDQAVVKGCLLLLGTYSGQADGEARETKSLEHTIPVEITLPINRIRSVDDISVEIENFDIDLLSPRSLNVTGVLTLNGIEMLPGQADGWQTEEEILFVHEPAKEGESFNTAGNPVRVSEESDDLQSSDDPSGRVEQQQEEPSATVAAMSQTKEKIRDQLPDNNYDDYEALAQYDEAEAKAAKEAKEAEDKMNESAGSVVEEAVAVVEEADKGEMKIAFGSKKPEQPFDLKSYLSKSDDYRDKPAPAEPVSTVSRPEKAFRSEPVPIAKPETVGESDALEWKNLFLSANEEQQFRKVRLCIVHKDDTLESIAKKYDRKPQEIRLHNSLSDQELSEGQVIYIP